MIMQSKKYYVTMTDSFLSNWGMSDKRINKLVFECDNMSEAFIVEQNAKNRTDQIYINIAAKKPYYSKERYYVQYKTKKEYSAWYEKDYFKNRYNS